MKAVVVAAGALHGLDGSQLDDADLVIAADGGASLLDSIGRRPDLLVGDLDSAPSALVERLAADGVPVERHPADKEASDTELAVEAALAAGADEVVLLGATGRERLDHELANLLLLVDPRLPRGRVHAVRGRTRARGVLGGEAIEVGQREGDIVSLLPVGGEATGVTTTGLRWPLAGATLAPGRSRGLSNVVVAPPASVTLGGGALLVVETTADEADQREGTP